MHTLPLGIVSMAAVLADRSGYGYWATVRLCVCPGETDAEFLPSAPSWSAAANISEAAFGEAR